MGKAIILKDSDFSGFGLGVVTPNGMLILPSVNKITSATTFRVEKDGAQLTSVSWAISDNTLASLVNNGDGTCTVTPLVDNNTVQVQLSATASGKTTTISFVAAIFAPVYVWHIDRCTASPASGSLNDANLANGGWAYREVDNATLQGKKINSVKIVPSQAGLFEIRTASSLSGNTTLVASFTIESADVGNVTTYTFDTFTLGSGKFLVFGKANSAGGFKYYQDTADTQRGFYSKVPSNPTPSTQNEYGKADLNFSVGYYGLPED